MSTSTSTSSPSWKSAVLSAVGAAAVAGAGYTLYKAYQKRTIVQRKVKELEQFPIIELKQYLENKNTNSSSYKSDCALIARLLHEYGILIVRDPRVSEKDNDVFLDLLEKYYEQPEEVRNEDARPDLHYQVGVTPERVEKARNHCGRIANLSPADKPLTQCPPEVDNKSRFFWRMGERPPQTEFPQMNMPSVIPKNFPEWPAVMNKWGTLMLDAVHTVAEMAALGFHLPLDSFTSRMNYGPHLLAPTASDLEKNGQKGTVFASYHYDLNFLTIHGRSRFPGLFLWTREGRKMAVKVPPGCLLLQAGKQFEWLTGGEVLAGFHEVVVVDSTLDAVKKAKEADRSLWRISSTLFAHIASDQTLEPLPPFAKKMPQSVEQYPATKAGKQVLAELEAIKLAGVNGMV